MIARFDHRLMLTAALALSTTVLIVVVVTLSTLLLTAAHPAANSSSESGANPGAAVAVPGTGENYGEGWNNYGHDEDLPQPAQKGDSYRDGPWNNYGHDVLPPKPTQTGGSQRSDSAQRQEVGHP